MRAVTAVVGAVIFVAGAGAGATKVLLLVHPDTADARRSVQDVIATYRKVSQQQSVLWEGSRVCVTS